MVHYTQVKEIERMRIYSCLKMGFTLSMIAQTIGRDKSTISRELARNSDRIGSRDAQKKPRNAKRGMEAN